MINDGRTETLNTVLLECKVNILYKVSYIGVWVIPEYTEVYFIKEVLNYEGEGAVSAEVTIKIIIAVLIIHHRFYFT